MLRAGEDAEIIDISLPLGPDLLIWPGNPELSTAPASRIASGDPANVSVLSMGTHTGTHVDPPLHFVPEGTGAHELALRSLVGPAVVADLRGVETRIGASELDALDLPAGTQRVLMKTRNSDLWSQLPVAFPSDYVSLSEEGARWVVDRGIKLVGTDFLGIEARRQPGAPTHHILLEDGVVIVEGLDLRDVNPGTYWFVCLPLKLVDGDGAPARAILISDARLDGQA